MRLAGYKTGMFPRPCPTCCRPAHGGMGVFAATGPDGGAGTGAFEDRLAWMRGARSDYEIALPLHELEAFAMGTGYYSGLPLAVRLGQIDRMIDLAEALYPALRLYLIDARRVFSAPITFSARCWRSCILAGTTLHSATAGALKALPAISTGWCARPHSARGTCRPTCAAAGPDRLRGQNADRRVTS